MTENIHELIRRSLERLGYPEKKFTVHPPARPEIGDLASNVALTLAKELKQPPMEIAQSLIQTMKELDTDGLMKSIQAAPPGFINIRIQTDYYFRQLRNILQQTSSFGRSRTGHGKKALVEFVSANPTGPLTVAHGRGAVLGDCVSSILEWNGYQVQREYYFNNAGRQMKILGRSVYFRYMELIGEDVSFPDDHYQGNYILDIAEELKKEYGDSLAKRDPEDMIFRKTAEELIFTDIKNTLSRIHLVFDSFFNENELYENKAIDLVIARLKEKGLIYEKDGAVWFKGTQVGREADKVLIKSTGEPTYRLPDMAYHQNKFHRGFHRIVDVFGADHADTFPDVLAVMKVLGYDTEKIKVLIHQFVTIIKDGEQVKMSTRKANFISLENLVEEVGADVVRYFFIMRGMNTHLNFDLELAKDQSDVNPVYYLQYAHARVCNILARAEAFERVLDPEADLSPLGKDIELQLIRKLLEFPRVISRAEDTLEPQGIATYLQELATIFHRFYARERVITDDIPLTSARLVLIEAFRIVLANGLNILGLSAPERM